MQHGSTSRGAISRTILVATALSAERRRGPGFPAVLVFWLLLGVTLYVKYMR